MKAIKFFAITAMAAAMITSCSSDDEWSQSNYPSDNIIRVTAGVNNAKTRADGQGVSAMDNPFSLTVVNKNNDDADLNRKYTYVNEVFAKVNDEWKCKDTLLWQKASLPVDIVALAPAADPALPTAGTDNEIFNKIYDGSEFHSLPYSVAEDQTTADDKNDLLYYYSKGFVPKDKLVDQKLNIQFNHAFCMIDIKVTLGTEFNKPSIPTTSPITKVILGGTITEASVNATKANTPDGVVAVDTSAPAADIITTNGTFTEAANAESYCHSTFSCIAIPQTVAANTFKVSLMTAGKRYEWTSKDPVELKSGYRYTLELSMGNDVVLLKSDKITATPWGKGTGDTLETD